MIGNAGNTEALAGLTRPGARRRRLARARLRLWVLLAPALFAPGLPGPAGAAPDDARVLLDRAFQNLYAEDYVQGLTLSTQARGGTEMRRDLQIVRRQSVRPGKALLRFLYPQTIRKTSVLVLENDEGDDDLYVYLPAIKLTRRLSAAQRADAFFGTDLSYEDVQPKFASDYEITWRPAEDGDVEGRESGLACRWVEYRIRPDLASGYERTTACIEPARAIMLRSEFFVRGERIKTLVVDPAEVKRIGRRYVPFSMTMETPRRRSRTRIVTESYELRSEIPDELFSTVNLYGGNARADLRKTTAAPEPETADPDPVLNVGE